MGTELPAVSLFSGAGGLDLGLQAASARLTFRAWVEIDPEARATLLANSPKLESSGAFFADITSVDASTLMRVADIAPGEAFLLAGGPPCQAFSTAGLRQTISDPNGRAVQSYFEMVRHLRPRFFVFENVRGLLSAALKHRPLVDRSHPQEVPADSDAQLGSVMRKFILPAFARLGYEVTYGLLNSADYGTAQVRHRVFVLGSREREFGTGTFRKQTGRPMMPLDLVPATHHRHAPYLPLSPWRTLADAIGHLRGHPPPDETYSYSPERADVFARIPPGQNWTFVRDNLTQFPAGYLQQIMGRAYFATGGKEGFWRRLAWDRPSPTLTAQPQQLATSLCHPEELRPLSIAEYAALQDFPSDYHFHGSKAGRYRQIGNAVPVRLAAAIGAALLAIAGENRVGLRSADPRSRTERSVAVA